ncbi:MAG: putative motility protein [Lachnospiraceae bacterium]|nr:putative motility protein [Lachnospiraceae bacterium]
MNIPELSTALSNVKLMDQVSTAVLSKALDNSEAAGESLINMMDRSMELSVNPAVGSNFDMFI